MEPKFIEVYDTTLRAWVEAMLAPEEVEYYTLSDMLPTGRGVTVLRLNPSPTRTPALKVVEVERFDVLLHAMRNISFMAEEAAISVGEGGGDRLRRRIEAAARISALAKKALAAVEAADVR